MTESRIKTWDVSIKATATIIALLGAIIGIWKYSDTVEKEFRKPFWEQQVALYFDATSAASTLASSLDSTALFKAKEKFYELYYGPLAVVEDTEVEAAMVRFDRCLQALETGSCTRTELKNLSLALAHSCRESIGRAWELDLSKLEGKYNR